MDVDGSRAWLLEPAEAAEPPDVVRLLGSHDLLLQTRNRDLLVPDASRHKALWPVIGRPGAVLVGTDIVGTLAPAGLRPGLTLRLDLWASPTQAVRARIEDEAERLAAHRGVRA